MAPKPASASKPSPGKKPTSAKKGESGTTSIVATTTEPTDEVQTFAPAKTKEEVLQQVSFDGLPVADPAQIIEILSGKYKQLIEVFAHCCKFSDCKTMEMATRCRLGALSHLAQAHVGAPLEGASYYRPNHSSSCGSMHYTPSPFSFAEHTAAQRPLH